MKLKTSYFNSAVFRKNMTRFAPAWVLYGIFLLLILATMADANSQASNLASDLGNSLMPFALLNAGYALLCAQLVFGDLFNARMCNALHAMPMRRECWFLTNALSGLFFFLLPTAVMAGLSILFLRQYLYVALVWLLGMLLQYLFFYGVAVFSVFCVGNRFAMVLVYGIINFLSILAYWLVYTFYEPLLYGIEVNTEPFLLVCPFVKFLTLDVMAVRPVVGILWVTMAYYAICAAVGLLFLGAGLALYRKRALENAGDFMAVRRLSPVFLVLYTFCAGAALYLFNKLFVSEDTMLFLLLGVVGGFFTGKMLILRTVRVFTKRSFLQLGALLGAFILTVVLTWLDPLGITRWVPKENEVAQITISEGGSYSDQVVTISDPVLIQEALAIHQQGVDDRDGGFNGKPDVKIFISYKLKSGMTALRNYYIDVDTDAGRCLQKYLSTPDCVLGISYHELSDPKDLVRIEIGKSEVEITDAQQMQGLLAALAMDCQAGNMAQSGSFHQGEDQAEWIYLVTEMDDRSVNYRFIQIYECCENTTRWLREQGYTSETLPQ